MAINLSDIDTPMSDIEVISESLVRIYLTYSNTNLFQSCRYKYWVRQIGQLSPKARKTTLKLGGAYHDGIETYYNKANKDLDTDALIEAHKSVDDSMTEKDGSIDIVSAVKAKALVKGFVRKFKDSPYKLIEQERPFVVKMEDAPDFELNGVKYEFWIAGKIDGIMEDTRNHKVYIGEWKTCANFKSFTDMIKQDNQPWQYMLGNYLHHNVDPEGVIYRLARKTMIRQRKNESEAEFCERIVDLYETDYEEYFLEEKIPFDPKRMDRHIDYLNSIALDISLAFKNELWYRNRGSCYAYNSPCPYMSLCNTYSHSDFNHVASLNYEIVVPNAELGEEIAKAAEAT